MTPKQRKNNGYSLVNPYTRAEPTQSFMRILVQSSTNPNEQRKLTLFNKQVEELIAHMNLNLDLNNVSETEITLAILIENKPVTITYDSHYNKIQTIAI